MPFASSARDSRLMDDYQVRILQREVSQFESYETDRQSLYDLVRNLRGLLSASEIRDTQIVEAFESLALPESFPRGTIRFGSNVQ